MTILNDLLIEQAKIAGKIARERSIESFVKAASNAVGHFLTIRIDDVPYYRRNYVIISPTTVRWTYSDHESDLEEIIREYLSTVSADGDSYTISIDFCP